MIEMFKLLNGFLDQLQFHLQSEYTIPPQLQEVLVNSSPNLTIGMNTQLMKEGCVCEWIECLLLSGQ